MTQKKQPGEKEEKKTPNVPVRAPFTTVKGHFPELAANKYSWKDQML